MSKSEKQINKLRVGKTITWDELKSALKSLGYVVVEGDGSRVKFENGNPSELVNLHKPHPGNEVKSYALRQVREKLIKWGKL